MRVTYTLKALLKRILDKTVQINCENRVQIQGKYYTSVRI